LNLYCCWVVCQYQSFKIWRGGQPDPRIGFQVLTGSPSRPGQFWFFLNQNHVVLVKKTKVNGLQPSFWSGLAGSPGQSGGSSRVLTSSIFLNPTRFQSRIGLVPSRPTGPGRFQNYGQYCNIYRQCVQINGNRKRANGFANWIK
jgi:hypothetical protein